MATNKLIKFFGINGCVRCKKAEDFLKSHKFNYERKNLTTEKLTPQEIKDMVFLSDNGFEDIVVSKSSAFKKVNNDFESLKYNEAIKFIIDNPQVVHRPIIIQYINNHPYRLLIGYNASDLKILLRKDDEKYFSSTVCEFFDDMCHFKFANHKDECDEDLEDE